MFSFKLKKTPNTLNNNNFIESKLSKLKKPNPNKITGRDLISSMSQFREIYMQDYLANSNSSTSESSIIVENIDKTYLEVRIR